MLIETKYFTPAEATKTLPLVKKIVDDILITTKEMRLYAEDVNGQIENDPFIKKMAENVEGFIKELEEIGCFYKDWNFTIGLVDFPSIIDGEEVYLCWRSDEERIKFYHDIDSGFSSRRVIPEEYL
ncbi:MAG: DUF2203 domain-containing protein [Ignavibacteriaceae bacterium]|nr:DUF2203 domain-containing protein [Ignavibacteriaceae bacterium]